MLKPALHAQIGKKTLINRLVVLLVESRMELLFFEAGYQMLSRYHSTDHGIANAFASSRVDERSRIATQQKAMA